MEPLNKTNVEDYLKRNVFSHLKFVKSGQIQDVKIANAGLVSHVLRVVVDETPFYIKQSIPGQQKYLKIFKTPADFNYLFNDQRQIYELKALKIFEKAVGRGIAPHIYFYDKKNQILILSEVCFPKAKLLEDIISQEVNLKASIKLAKIAAELVNNTYDQIKPLRPYDGDQKIKFIKLKYQCLEVYQKLSSDVAVSVKKAQEKLIQESMEINNVLVHGDYHPRNILIDEEDVGTFDLEEAHLGDPAFDIGILLGSYLLRAVYYPKIRAQAFRAMKAMIQEFYNSLKVPEEKQALDRRIKQHAGGLMLCRIDGLPSRWTKWVKDERKKEKIRTVAADFILDQSNFCELLDKWKNKFGIIDLCLS